MNQYRGLVVAEILIFEFPGKVACGSSSLPELSMGLENLLYQSIHSE